MRKITFRANFGCDGAQRSLTVVYLDDVTEEEIDKDLELWASGLLDLRREEES